MASIQMIQWDGPQFRNTFTGNQAGQDVSIGFVPTKGKRHLSTVYTPNGWACMRKWTLLGPDGLEMGHQFTPSWSIYMQVGPEVAMHWGSIKMVSVYGLTAGASYTLLVQNIHPDGSRSDDGGSARTLDFLVDLNPVK
jgi:hypothetical protein